MNITTQNNTYNSILHEWRSKCTERILMNIKILIDHQKIKNKEVAQLFFTRIPSVWLTLSLDKLN